MRELKRLTFAPIKTMRFCLTFIFIVCSICTTLGQSKKEKDIITKSDNSLTNYNGTIASQIITDTLKVQFIPVNSNSNHNNNSWRITLTVGILAFLATLIAASLSGWIAIKGIRTNKEIAVNQIENLQRNTRMQFFATLKTKNRQDWINEVRTSISELIANCIKINIEFQNQGNNSTQKIKDIHEKISLHRAKLLLLLSANTNKTTHSELLASMKTLIDKLDNHILNYRNNINDWNNFEFQNACDKLVEDGRNLVYGEWKEIQQFENYY